MILRAHRHLGAGPDTRAQPSARHSRARQGREGEVDDVAAVVREAQAPRVAGVEAGEGGVFAREHDRLPEPGRGGVKRAAAQKGVRVHAGIVKEAPRPLAQRRGRRRPLHRVPGHRDLRGEGAIVQTKVGEVLDLERGLKGQGVGQELRVRDHAVQ